MNTHASLLIHNARVYTVDAPRPWAEAVAVVGDRIAYVGDEAGARPFVGPRTELIDAGGRLLLPGLIDSHIHFLMGARSRDGVLFAGDETLPACLEKLRAFAADHPEREWISGRGWTYRMFPQGVAISRELLDAVVPDRPVYLVAFDGHTAWANTVALERAGILAGADAGANSLVVLGDDGLASGELREGAIDLVRRLIPPLSPADDERLLREALGEAAALGLTSVHNMDGTPRQIALYAAFEQRGELTLRIRCPMSVSPETPIEQLDEFAAVAAQYRGPFVTGGSVKLFMDGVVESKTALLLAPYADGSGECGAANYEFEQFVALATRADALGQQVIVHAIGDGAVRRTLDAFERVRAANGPRDSRHRVEHIELIDPADLPRFEQLGALGSVQPLHTDFGYDEANPWRRLVGPARWPLGFAWRTLRAANVPLALGSDWPVVSHNPFKGIHSALTRIKLDYSGPDSPFPDQKLTLEETIAGYTSYAAYAEFQEQEKGQLRPGMLADMVLLSDNLFAIPPEQTAEVRPVLTICGGRVVYGW